MLVYRKHCKGRRRCTKKVNYGDRTSNVINYCYACKLPNMITAADMLKMCTGFEKDEKCHLHKMPTFGFEKGKPLRCSEHREYGMKNVVNQSCPYAIGNKVCGERAYVQFKHESNGILHQYCGKHYKILTISI